MFDGEQSDIPSGYQRVKYHLIFDIVMGENFRRKPRYIAGGHTTEIPAILTSSSVLSRDNLRISFTIAVLNDLKVSAYDIQNAYLIAKYRKKIWTKAEPEFGSDEGKIMMIVYALYRLRSSGAAFKTLLAKVLHDLRYLPSKADSDVLIRSAVKSNVFKYYEYVLCYVGNVICINDNPSSTMFGLQDKIELKDDKNEEPSIYLGI